ncbi:MAG: prepilin-type N-terminal cleavage/methylation domain-containing protein, partial [Comamonadaceae bacterium]
MVDTQSRSGPVALRQHQGFTVIESMVVVAVLGILAALAAPSFTAVIQNWRIRQISDELAFSFASARSEAIRRGGGIVVRRIHPNDTDCPGLVSASGRECGCGWFVFADTDGDGERGENEPVIRTSAAARRLRVERTAAA